MATEPTFEIIEAAGGRSSMVARIVWDTTGKLIVLGGLVALLAIFGFSSDAPDSTTNAAFSGNCPVRISGENSHYDILTSISDGSSNTYLNIIDPQGKVALKIVFDTHGMYSFFSSKNYKSTEANTDSFHFGYVRERADSERLSASYNNCNYGIQRTAYGTVIVSAESVLKSLDEPGRAQHINVDQEGNIIR